ncbi:MAG: dTDP-4-dehydrorhamnose 3,5-epimerase family protein [bacterium]|nr:dTDP-4-dehydrorhamnose 3,5-epimerase family protein [bacterium]
MLKKLDLSKIDPKYKRDITTQGYRKKQMIDGVQIVNLNIMSAPDGYFLELGRLIDEGHLEQFPDFKVEQINLSVIEPGGVKGWHVHYNQEDLWHITVDSMVLVGLHDLRKDSPTMGMEMKFPMGNHKSQLLFIPRGVAHGVANISIRPATMVYLVNQQFDTNDPDEKRLPVDIFGKDFWEMPKG